MKNLYAIFVLLVALIIQPTNLSSQDHIISSIPDFYCGDLDAPPSGIQWPYFVMNADTLKVLVVFCNFPDENFDPSPPFNVYTQHWPGSSHLTKPSWADSIICPTTTNVWNRSLTGLFRDASRNKFWLIGDVYPELYVFENQKRYYSIDSGRNISYAVKELLENIDGEVDFSDYDRLDPRDFDNDDNRREPDGVVDFIFINFRFNNSKLLDPDPITGRGYSGIAKLGGHRNTFAGDTALYLDGKYILPIHPGSGALYEMWTPWHIGVPAHEFGEHYSYGGGHSGGLGAFNIQAGALASAYDREWIGWNTGVQYTPTSNTSITLRDYITTGDYAKINVGGDTFIYVENRRRISYYASEQYKNWHWLASEPLYPIHPDSGLLIYKKTGHRAFISESANGRWNWQKCDNPYYRVNWSSSTFNIWFQSNLNRYGGESTFDLHNKYIKDVNCNVIGGGISSSNEINYRGAGGDSNTCFDVGYNDVYSPWSNPPLRVANSNDSLTIEIAGKDENGDMGVNIYFTNITQAKPSKPQYLKTSQHFFTPQETIFHPKLDWEQNFEPDHDYYKIYRGAITTPGVDPTYYYIGYTRDTTFIDENIDLYVAQGGSGICTYQYKAYSYRITAIDDTEKESVKSEKDTIWGYSDPCAPEDTPFGNIPNIDFDYSLEQNYPNPFNPVTKISYSIKEPSFVSLKVFNILGQEVETLVKELKNKGNYSVAFNAENKNLSSGIYYYQLEVKNGNRIVYSMVKRMVLIK